MNNFDTSSAGVNIEFNGFYDNDLSSMLFNDEFEIIQCAGCRKTSKLFYVSGGEYSFSGDLKDYYVYPENANIRELLIKLYQWSGESAVSFIDIVQHVTGKNTRQLSLDDISEIAQYIFQDEYQKEWLENVCEFTLNSVGVTGYCQGDYAEVYYPKTIKVNVDYFEKLLYASPVYARLTIDDEELYIDELLSDNYQWEKSEVLASIEKNLAHDKKEYIMEWLADNLPRELDYH